jgi:hypothetical protein
MLRYTVILICASATVAQAQEFTGWQVQESRPSSDSVAEVTLLLRAESNVRTRGVSERPIMIIQCVQGRTELGVYTGPYQPSRNHKHAVRYRLDRMRPVLAEWNESQGSRAVFHPNPRFLLFDLMITDLMLFEYSNYEGDRVIARFRTFGLDEHLPKVARACGWEDELPGR